MMDSKRSFMKNMKWVNIFHQWTSMMLLCLFMTLPSSSSVFLNDDVLGLIVFKADLMDPTKALRSWVEDDESPCNWTGIVCNPQTGRVISLDLKGFSLSGHIGWGLGKVTYLQTLSLAHNNLSGTISSNVAQLSLLKSLDLSHNVFSGPVDAALGTLSFLKHLDLSYNLLSGVIPPAFFSKCGSLNYLSLRNNRLEGTIPSTALSCTALRTLDLSRNRLNEVLPTRMETLTGLEMLDLSYNLIPGPMPIMLPPKLVDLRIQSNQLSGGISPQISNCSSLQSIDLSSNFLSSELPSSMHSMTSLTFLQVSDNNLSGNVPNWINSLVSLRVLNMSHNAFHGQIPSALGFLKFLEVADISHNKLSGPISPKLSSCLSMKYIDLSSNKLNGPIPGNIVSTGLISLNLADNLLAGELSKSFFRQCNSLQILNLAQNHLSGLFPAVPACAKMVYLNISNNLFQGDISNISQCSQLVTLDLSHNQLSGNVPAWFQKDCELSILFLQRNKLIGSIPSSIGNCSSLGEIDLSDNNLQGSIPPQLSNLKQLKALDLSHNNLTGELPQALDEMHNLTRFNVSYNRLQGPIPDNGVYAQFNASSYDGNPGLCGPMIKLPCPSVMPKPIFLNPDYSKPHQMGSANPWNTIEHTHMLSASAILAIAAAAAISVGVVIISVLNGYAKDLVPKSYSDILRSNLSPTPSPENSGGKLVMFSQNSYPRAEEWITSAHHVLLNKESELGRGGFGTVYKAVLGDGRIVAIRKLMTSSMVKSQEEFAKEMQILGSVKHPSLLKLQGYYWTPQLQLLIYDFIANGNLYSKLHERTATDSPITWTRRFRIALGVARGLAHLHHMCQPQIIHYNVKSSNVLLDDDYNPQLADYGLANLLPMLDKYLMSSKYQSALGYMAPEFACQSSRINEKCDVYGYGIMVLELVTGRHPIAYREDDVLILCDHVRSLLDEDKALSCVDQSLQDYAEEEVLPMIKLGLICTSQVPSNRPSMAEVVQILEIIRTGGGN
ncbi:hypothetical protein KP509_31G064200 [Ceratopteris richardii]|uniref:Protein kinase domain-containing protein n=1 Tax=Ceratopteris richardii TaxID=49495 RepID=A0A8T2QYM1_CERRI|nr:hypothetical protein KP509_31G064200 [Ceratopteris richardii]